MGVPFAEMGEDPVHMLLYGKNGVGKTTFACEFPKPLALISVEAAGKTGGARSVKRVEGGTHFRFKQSEKVMELGNRLRGGPNPFATVVLDSGTSLDEIILAEVCGWDETANMNRWGKVSMDEYAERSERMRKVLRPFLDLECDVVLICNEKDHNSQEGSRKSAMVRSLHTESFFAPAMGGGTARWTMDGCDYVCQLFIDKEIVIRKRSVGKEGTASYKVLTSEVETGKFVRRLRTSYHPNFAARVRSESSETVPEFIEANTASEMFERFMRVVRGEAQE